MYKNIGECKKESWCVRNNVEQDARIKYADRYDK
jgi:hypothetical protein